MNRGFFAVIDDRELPPAETQRLCGDVHFGDLLRRRRRYLDELHAAATQADEVIILRSDEEAERLVRRIEAMRGEAVWLRMPTATAPLNMDAMGFLIAKMRYALETMVLSPVQADDAHMLLRPQQMITLLAAQSAKSKRAQVLEIVQNATEVTHDLAFADLRQTASLSSFLSGATEPRAFNTLAADQEIYVKSSMDVAKMRAEHDFYALARPEVQRFLLPTFGYEEKAGIASYRMENLRVPDAALQFVLGSLDKAGFARLLDQFFAFINARDRDAVGRAAVQDAGTQQILKKLKDRLARFADTEAFGRVNAALKAGGVEDGLEGLNRRAEPLITRVLQDHGSDYLAFSHGDPCLSNILFDSRIGLFRLIDPRGATARAEALMHPLYDLAKFSHSVLGGYDFINNELFAIEVGADLRIKLRYQGDGAPVWMRTAFEARLKAEGWEITAVRAVEASLFLSMLPLHLDHERKLLGFALIAQDILNELETV
ncbi:MAG: hypothetical protein AAF553_09540 [Pseudomonadota bacterium]